MTLRSDLMTDLENTIRDEAYDGSLGAFTEEQFARMCRRIAEAAYEVVEAELDARWEHSDHATAKYYRRMRDAEREMHARELRGELVWDHDTAVPAAQGGHSG